MAEGRLKKRPAFKDWVQAARAPFLVASMVPQLLGFALAGKDTGVWQTGLFILVLLGCFGLHLATQLGNDYFDHVQGADENTIGGSRAIQEGKIEPRQYIRVMLFLYIFVAVLGCFGAWHTGRYGIIGLVAFGIFGSFFYVGPPIRYGYRALGEVMVFLCMGLGMSVGTYYTLTGLWPLRVFILSVPVGLMIAGIMNYQNLPEIETDPLAGKRTLATILGPRRAVRLFYLWWPVIWALMILFWLWGECSWFVLVGIGLSLPMYLKLVGYVRNVKGDWVSLDAHGHYVRKMYLVGGMSLVAAVLMA